MYQVNGQLSQTCYLRALDSCYARLARKKRPAMSSACAAPAAPVAVDGGESGGGSGSAGHEARRPFLLDDVEHVLCHSPYNKLVQKSFARMVFADARRLRVEGGGALGEGQEAALGKWLDLPAEVCFVCVFVCVGVGMCVGVCRCVFNFTS